eukprot:gene9256-8325_t
MLAAALTVWLGAPGSAALSLKDRLGEMSQMDVNSILDEGSLD